MNFPTDCLYAASHEWVRIEGGEAVIGITSFAQEQLGDITYVDVPAVGTTLSKGAEFGSIESVKAASELYSPVNGEVVAVNEALESKPELVNEAPFAEGWLLRVRLADAPEGLPKSLMDVAAYTAHVASEAH